ncbi:hypothetical protein GCM10020001_013640 [Nonomuraea salmonea]
MNGDALLIIGDVVTDVVALHGSPVLAGEDTAAEIVLRPGGSGANTAAWAACLGAEVHLLAKLGYDSSEWHATELINTGVQPHFSVDPDHPTAVVIAMVDKSGERSMLTNRGAGDLISEDDWDPALLDGVGRLHLSGYVLFAEPGLRLAARAMADAVAAGITVSVDPASTGPLRDFGVERFMQATAAAELILPNLDEALLLTGVTSAERAAVLLSERYGTAVVKLGAEGRWPRETVRWWRRPRADPLRSWTRRAQVTPSPPGSSPRRCAAPGRGRLWRWVAVPVPHVWPRWAAVHGTVWI